MVNELKKFKKYFKKLMKQLNQFIKRKLFFNEYFKCLLLEIYVVRDNLINVHIVNHMFNIQMCSVSTKVSRVSRVLV